MSSNISGAFVIFVVHRSSVFELEFLKITAGFGYMGVTRSNQNILHEEFHSLLTNKIYITSKIIGFVSWPIQHIFRPIMFFIVQIFVVPSSRFYRVLCKG
jgi:hypothetical protein